MVIYHDHQEVPIVEESDVVVCGGGPAGVAAAVAAARAGASVRLLELQGCLGGVWTAGPVCWVIDSANKTGIMAEIGHRLEQRDARYGRGNHYGFDPEAMKLTLEEMCLEAGVRIQLHTRVSAAARQGRRLDMVLTESLSGREAWKAQTFIDCTGNGDLAAYAGCSFEVGRPESGETQPMTLLCLLTGIDPEAAHDFVAWPDEPHRECKRLLLEEMREAGVEPSYHGPTLFWLGKGLYCLSSNHEYGLSGLDAADVTQATLRARAELYRQVDALRAKGGIWEDVRLVATGNMIGIREGRRVKGLYTVDEEDIRAGRQHEDAVTTVTVGIDVHSTNTSETKSYSKENRIRTQPYDIPLRALIAADVDGLLMAGRDISGDFLAHSSYRMTATATSLGQAAGTLAALAANEAILPQDVPWAQVSASLARLRGERAPA